MIEALRAPAACRRPGPGRAPLDYDSCRAWALGVAMTYFRRLSGLDIDTAAGCACITPYELAGIEQGAAAPTSDTLFVLADVYRTDIVEVFARTMWIADRLLAARWRP